MHFEQHLLNEIATDVDALALGHVVVPFAVEALDSTLFHELTHATGHANRLNRKGIAEFDKFGSAQYAREELIAEMGAAFLCGHCGIEQATLDNSAAYIASWIRTLRGDPMLAVTAAAQAQKASDWVLGKVFMTMLG